MKDLLFELESYDGDDSWTPWEATFICVSNPDYSMRILGDYWCEIQIAYKGNEIAKITSDYINIKDMAVNTVGINFYKIKEDIYKYKVTLENNEFVKIEEIEK